MNIQPSCQSKKSYGSLIAGSILVYVGVITLLGQYIQAEWFGLLFLPTLGAAFLLWGLIARQTGLLVPGGILSGLGAGALLSTGLLTNLSDEAKGGVVLISFACGWALITLLSAAIRQTMWWPIIPGGILGCIGVLLLAGETGLKVLELAGKVWPVALILVGVVILFRKK